MAEIQEYIFPSKWSSECTNYIKNSENHGTCLKCNKLIQNHSIIKKTNCNKINNYTNYINNRKKYCESCTVRKINSNYQNNEETVVPNFVPEKDQVENVYEENNKNKHENHSYMNNLEESIKQLESFIKNSKNKKKKNKKIEINKKKKKNSLSIYYKIIYIYYIFK